MRRFFLAITISAAVAGASQAVPAAAQTGAQQPVPTLGAFLSRANRIPHNALAMVHPQRGRVQREFEAAFLVVAREQHEAEDAGRQPRTCIPERFQFNPISVLNDLNAIPAGRHGMPLTQAVREWAARAYPCR